MQSTLTALESDSKAYRKAAEIVERLGDPADSLHNEELYVTALNKLANSFVLSNTEKERPKLLLEMASKNHVGTNATDIEYATTDGKTHRLLENDKIKLIFFNDLNCDACTKTKKAISESTALSELVKQGQLQVISIYTGNNQKAWKNNAIPDWVVNGWDKKQQIEKDEAYVLMTTPLFYLLNSDNTVLVKNEPSLSRIEKALGILSANADKNSQELIKLLFN